MRWRVVYHSKTGQIEHFVGNSFMVPPEEDLPKYDAKEYTSVLLEDPPFEVSRDHRFLFSPEGEITGTEPWPNPVQPVPIPAIDWAKEWAAAGTPEEKLKVIGKRLGME